MVIRRATIVALALLMTSCDLVQSQLAGSAGGGRPNPNAVKVTIVDEAVIVVDQDPIYISASNPNKRIRWELPKSGQYKFDKNDGIVVSPGPNGQVVFRCHSEENDYRFSCDNDAVKGDYKYKVHVVGPKTIPVLDPFIKNG